MFFVAEEKASELNYPKTSTGICFASVLVHLEGNEDSERGHGDRGDGEHNGVRVVSKVGEHSVIEATCANDFQVEIVVGR